ncbi:hypothetical protein BBF96_07840 [Anoxybacter fermentans]|uniref:Uncharacterized protein n=1 Tax=Anoxybacter fermentans TaxID=1323375 RepID=A0A3Q9HQB3_9FIRM|nr:hypothetical protein BBF96_07840 [Anoxybacter fermentans]
MQVWSVFNKADLDDEMSKKILTFCEEKDVMVVGQIPFDKKMPWLLVCEYLQLNIKKALVQAL